MTGLSQERLDEIRDRLPLPNTNLSQNMEYAHPGSGEWMANAQRDLTVLLAGVERLLAEVPEMIANRIAERRPSG